MLRVHVSLVVGEAALGDAVSFRVDGELFSDAQRDYHRVLDQVDNVKWDDKGESVGDFTEEAGADHIVVDFGRLVVAVLDQGFVFGCAIFVRWLGREGKFGTLFESAAERGP